MHPDAWAGPLGDALDELKGNKYSRFATHGMLDVAATIRQMLAPNAVSFCIQHGMIYQLFRDSKGFILQWGKSHRRLNLLTNSRIQYPFVQVELESVLVHNDHVTVRYAYATPFDHRWYRMEYREANEQVARADRIKIGTNRYLHPNTRAYAKVYPNRTLIHHMHSDAITIRFEFGDEYRLLRNGLVVREMS